MHAQNAILEGSGSKTVQMLEQIKNADLFWKCVSFGEMFIGKISQLYYAISGRRKRTSE